MSDRAIETFSAFADDYEASRRLMIEPYDVFYDTTVAALALAQRPVRRVLELGAGTGGLTRRVRAALPEAELEIVERAGHWPWIDRPEVIDGVLEHLAPLG